MNLAIDIGNTLAKLALIDEGQVIDFLKTEQLDQSYLDLLLTNYPEVDRAIIVSSREADHTIESFLEKRVNQLLRFDSTIPVPIKNGYHTPETLGSDRLAAAVGGNTLYPNSNVLIVDFGTAITIDFVSSDNEFLGGNISAGARTRLRALHQFTQKLPLCELSAESTLLGKTSQEALQNGVANGITYEVEGYIRDFSQKYNDLRIIFTGGEGDFFAKRLKNPIFVAYDLVAYGLNRILEYNAK